MRKNGLSALVGLVLTTVTMTANGSVRFTQADYTATPDGMISVDLIGEAFSAGPDGGAFSLTWDSNVLQYIGTTVANPPWDTSTVNEDSIATGLLDFVFLGKSVGDAGTDFDIATFEFSVVGAVGDSSLLQAADTVSGWVAPGATPIAVDYIDSNVNIVPIPAAMWLLGSGFVGLVGIARRKERTS